MSELMNKLSKENIRASLNLLYSMMKFTSMLLDLAVDSQAARETLTDTASGLFEQTAVLLHDINVYAERLSDEGIQGYHTEIECITDNYIEKR